MESPAVRPRRWRDAGRAALVAALAGGAGVATVALLADPPSAAVVVAAVGVAVVVGGGIGALADGGAGGDATRTGDRDAAPPSPSSDEVRRRAEDRLRAALADADDEDQALDALHGAVSQWWPGTWSGVLASDRGGTTLVPAALADGPGHPAAANPDAATCRALRHHRTAVSERSDDFDACRHLDAAPEPVSGVCVPIVLDGEALGVIRWIGAAGTPLPPDDVRSLEALAQLAAWRIGALAPAPAGAEVPHLDPLTGLLNRRSTGLAVRELVRGLVPFTLAVCDLDDFDAYNEVHGHDRGDRALRLLSRVLRSTLRPTDVLGRTGGDELMVAFPRTSSLDAAAALERVRESLVLALTQEDLPVFTASFGVADSNQADSIEGIVRTAQAAVTLAKQAGRNRVVVAGEGTEGVPGS